MVGGGGAGSGGERGVRTPKPFSVLVRETRCWVAEGDEDEEEM